jgi:hypothetical protein
MAVFCQVAECRWTVGVVFRVLTCILVGGSVDTGVWRNIGKLHPNIGKLHPNDVVSIHPDALQCCQWRNYREAEEA